MKLIKNTLLCILFLFIVLPNTWAQGGGATVANVRFAQRSDGTGDVDVYYDLAGEAAPIFLSFSDDGGATFRGAVSVSGDVGGNVAPGLGKRIVWRAVSDAPGASSSRFVVRVAALRASPYGDFSPIPAGVYKCGENAKQTVTLSGYKMAAGHVTKAQWDEVRAWAGLNGYKDLSVGTGKAVNHPVVVVSWFDAVKWCNAASEKVGLVPCYRINGAVFRSGQDSSLVCDWQANGYRLPTEAEMEIAANAGSGWVFPWGQPQASKVRANYVGDTKQSYDLGPDGPHPDFDGGGNLRTSPVGYFAPNAFGLYDTAGNVFQWCWNWSGNVGYGSVDPRGPATAAARVLKGSSWASGANFMRTFAVHASIPEAGSVMFGFRLAASGGVQQGGMQSSSEGVLDTVPPVFSSLPADLILNASVEGGAKVTWPEATATDNRGAVSLLYSHQSGSVFGIGSTKVVVRAVDGSGNTAVGSFLVTVVDVTNVSNVKFSQRADGSKVVDVSYDLAGSAASVLLSVSLDGGVTYLVLPDASGDVGDAVSPGVGKRIVWNAGAAYPRISLSNVAFRVTALLNGGVGMLSPIPAGTFRRGNVIGDQDIVDAPVQDIQLGGYYIALTATTKAKWDAVRVWGVANGYSDLAAGNGKESLHPVTGVSWYDVVKWSNAASEMDGLTPCYMDAGVVYRTGIRDSVTCNWGANGYRLPTEAEWEVAARGGLTGRRFPWGDTISRDRANYNGGVRFAYDLGPVGYHPLYSRGGTPYTSPVASFPSNGYALSDMAGNVWQWCWDWYGSYSAVENPTGPANGVARVIRGGVWFGSAGQARTASRFSSEPGFTDRQAGFRVVRGVPVGGGISSVSSLGLLDTTPPVLAVVPGNIVAGAQTVAGAAVSWDPASAVDETGIVTVQYSRPIGSVFPIGATVVDVSAQDSVGNTTQNSFTVTVRDLTGPQITVPSDLTVEATSSSGAMVNYQAATASDNVSTEISLVYSKPRGSLFNLGVTPVTVTAMDDAGNVSTGRFNVTVLDTKPPIVHAPANLTVEATSPGGAVVNYEGWTSEDAVDDQLSVSSTHPNGSVFPLGVTQVKLTSVDDAGNEGTGTFSVTVVDRTAPVLTVPADVTVEASDENGAWVSYQPASAQDLVTANPTITYSSASGGRFPIGATTVRVEAVDAAGNRATGVFTVRVLELRAPVVIEQPNSVTLSQGGRIPLSVTAAGSPDLRYQWRKGGVDIPSATGAVFEIQSAELADSSVYTVVVSNPFGSVTSNGAVVTVRPSARLNFGRALYPQVKSLQEMVVPVTVRLLGGMTLPSKVEVMASSETLPSSAYALPASPTVLSWAPGDSTDKTIDLVLSAGQVIKPQGETIKLVLRNPEGALVGEIGEAIIALKPTETGVLDFESTSVERVKGQTGDLLVQMQVRRSLGSTGAVSVTAVGAGGSASSRDYEMSAPVVLNWGDGDAQPKSFAVRFKESALIGAAGKTLRLELRNPSGGALLGSRSTSTIVVRSQEATSKIEFQARLFTAVQAASGEVTFPLSIVRSVSPSGLVSVRLGVIGGTAVEGVDYALPQGPVVVSWADGEMGAKTVPLRILKPTNPGNSGKVIRLQLSDPSGNGVLGGIVTANVNIVPTDTNGPVVTIDSPVAGGRVSGKRVVIRGTVSDVSRLQGVTVTVNAGHPVDAMLTPLNGGGSFEWMVSVQPEEGENIAKVLAYDVSGNVSKEESRKFTFGYLRPEIAGTYDGLLEPSVDGDRLDTLLSDNPAFAQAFAISRGRGLVSLTISSQGAVTGRVTVGGVVLSFKGIVRRDGTILFAGGSDQLVVRSGRGQSGSVLGAASFRVRDTSPADVVGDFSIPESQTPLANIRAEKHVYSDAKVLPEGMVRIPESVMSSARENGSYTALFDSQEQGMAASGALTAHPFPKASGWSRIKVSPAGLVTLVGKLADGVPVSYSNRLSPSQELPLFVSLYGGAGFISGTVVFDDSQAQSDASSEALDWVRPMGGKGPYINGWPEGIRVGFSASKYTAPVKSVASKPLPLNPYTVFGSLAPVNTVPGDSLPSAAIVKIVLGGGGLSNEGSRTASVDLNNRLRLVGSDSGDNLFKSWVVKFSALTGGFSGSFIHPTTNKRVLFDGIVFQKTGDAIGGFVYEGTDSNPRSDGYVEMTLQLSAESAR